MQMSARCLTVNTAAYVPVNHFVGPRAEATLLVFSQYSQISFYWNKMSTGNKAVSPLCCSALHSSRYAPPMKSVDADAERDEVLQFPTGRASFQPERRDVPTGESLRDFGAMRGGKTEMEILVSCLPALSVFISVF